VIGVDSNVLVRYLTQDDPLQSRKANVLVEQVVRRGDTLYLNQIVVCEVYWVLARAYGYGRAELADAFEKLMSAAQFEFEDKAALWQALASFRQSGADFAECLIGIKNEAAGCASTLTFDKRAGGLPQFSMA
jgi:predicted nucleic-acid-binding protein